MGTKTLVEKIIKKKATPKKNIAKKTTVKKIPIHRTITEDEAPKTDTTTKPALLEIEVELGYDSWTAFSKTVTVLLCGAAILIYVVLLPELFNQLFN